MNLRNRLKKLERIANDSTACACYPKYIETFIQDLGEEALNNEPVLTSEAIPDVCPKCSKLTGKTQIIIQLVDAMTKDRFSDEWQAEINK